MNAAAALVAFLLAIGAVAAALAIGSWVRWRRRFRPQFDPQAWDAFLKRVRG